MKFLLYDECDVSTFMNCEVSALICTIYNIYTLKVKVEPKFHTIHESRNVTFHPYPESESRFCSLERREDQERGRCCAFSTFRTFGSCLFASCFVVVAMLCHCRDWPDNICVSSPHRSHNKVLSVIPPLAKKSAAIQGRRIDQSDSPKYIYIYISIYACCAVVCVDSPYNVHVCTTYKKR